MSRHNPFDPCPWAVLLAGLVIILFFFPGVVACSRIGADPEVQGPCRVVVGNQCKQP